MFEIGSSLREARLRQGADLVEAEAATKIRAKYLRALEDEQFDVLPAQTYVKAFLRNYADYLGLDGQLYVDEFNSRYVSGEDDAALVGARRGHASHAHRRLESNVLVLALVGIAVAAALVVGAWKWGGAEPNPIPNLPARQGSQPAGAQAPRPQCVGEAGSSWIALELLGTRTGSRVTVYRGSPNGKLLFDGTIEPGGRQCFVGGRVWFQAVAPRNLAARVNGRRAALPRAGRGPLTAVAGRRGIARTAA